MKKEDFKIPMRMNISVYDPPAMYQSVMYTHSSGMMAPMPYPGLPVGYH